MRLACVTNYNLLDQASWAEVWPGLGGAGFHLTRALERLGVEIEYVGPLTQHVPRWSGLKARLYRRLFRRGYHPWAETAVTGASLSSSRAVWQTFART